MTTIDGMSDREAPPVQMEDRDCPMGCPRDDEFVLRGRDRIHHKPGEFDVVRCRRCGLMRTNPRPVQAEIGFYYPSDYQAFAPPPVVRPRRRSPVTQTLRKVKRILLDSYGEALPISPPGILYEVGCANGNFLQRMRAEGWTVSGSEMSPHGVANAYALGLDVECSPLERATGPSRPADVVAGWNVIEHLHEPVDALRRVAGFLVPGGWLAASVPNSGSLDFRLFKEFWYALQLPVHLFHFTEDTLEMVLERAGFRIERVLHQRNLDNYYRSASYLANERNGLALKVGESISRVIASAGPLAQYADMPLATLVSILGQTGRMTFWARKA